MHTDPTSSHNIAQKLSLATAKLPHRWSKKRHVAQRTCASKQASTNSASAPYSTQPAACVMDPQLPISGVKKPSEFIRSRSSSSTIKWDSCNDKHTGTLGCYCPITRLESLMTPSPATIAWSKSFFFFFFFHVCRLLPDCCFTAAPSLSSDLFWAAFGFCSMRNGVRCTQKQDFKSKTAVNCFTKPAPWVVDDIMQGKSRNWESNAVDL